MQKGQKTNTKKGKKYKGQKTNTRKKTHIMGRVEHKNWENYIKGNFLQTLQTIDKTLIS